MKTYTVYATVTVSLSTVVEAENEGEALKIAAKRTIAEVVPSGDDSEEWIIDTDGEPEDLRIES